MKKIGVEVELARLPKLVVEVNGKVLPALQPVHDDTVMLPKVAVPTALKLPLMVVDPVMARDPVEVALPKSELPRSVVEPKRLDETELKAEVMVVEPVTANAVVVAPTAVNPPLKASCVVVALLGNR